VKIGLLRERHPFFVPNLRTANTTVLAFLTSLFLEDYALTSDFIKRIKFASKGIVQFLMLMEKVTLSKLLEVILVNRLPANPSDHPSENKPMKRENGIPIQASPQP